MKINPRLFLLIILTLSLTCPPAQARDMDAGEKRELELDLSNPTPVNAALRSLFIPGWGQYFNGQKAKGASLLLATAASLTGTIVLRSRAQHTLADYHAKGLPNDPLYDKYEKQHQQSVILQGAAVGFWLFSIVDAYLQARVMPADNEGLPGKHGPSFSFAPDGMAAAWRFGGENP